MNFVSFSMQLVLFAFCQFSILEALVLPNFYPFGQSEGDQLIPPNDDGSSGTVPISIQFPFFDQYHNSLFVSIILMCLEKSNSLVLNRKLKYSYVRRPEGERNCFGAL